MSRSLMKLRGLLSGLALLALPFAACTGDDGAAGVSTARFSGTVTNGANAGAPVANATITTSPAVPGLTITTDASGAFSAELPVGIYTVTCEAQYFESQSEALTPLAGIPITMDFVLEPVSGVALTISGAPSHPTPGAAFDLTVDAMPLDGSTVQSYSWSQVGNPMATITGETTMTASVTLADAAAYKQNLIDHLEPLDRWTVLGVDPHSAELAAEAVFEVTVTTTSGTFTEEVAVHADLDFVAWASGLHNVPVGVPVLLGGKDQATYDWALTGPGGSTATLMDGTDRFPWFVPDVEGAYTLAVTDAVAGAVTVDVRAAEWQGGITGIAGNGQPETTCAGCHAEGAEWAASGHAAIFTDNLNSGGHYSAGCFPCHTVGFDPTADNGGFDDTAVYDAFMSEFFAGGMSHPDPENWSNVVANYPAQAQLANIQCENCHGPNGASHINASVSALRRSVSADVCGYCHGEPPRHGRFQQWEESGHGNFELAIDESSAGGGSCAKCHTAQGFLEWFANGLDPSYSTAAVDPDEAQPITCVVCHDPHDVGTASGHGNDAPMRLEGDTPELLAGYTAYGVGKGAICFMCHNTRRGEASAVLTTTPDRAPHGGAQADVLMGKNAFFVTSNVRGAHSLIVDTCVACHVELTPPPASLSYNLGGTNHTFEADTSICATCHGGFEAEALIALTDSRMMALEHEIAVALEKEIGFHTANGRGVRISGVDANENPITTDITAASVIEILHVGSSHGRSAFDIKVDGVDYLHVQANGDAEILVGGNPDGNLLSNTYSSIEQEMSKILWNSNLIMNDGSSGVHNPGLVTEMIAATSAQIMANWP